MEQLQTRDLAAIANQNETKEIFLKYEAKIEEFPKFTMKKHCMWTIMSRLRHFAITGTKIIGNFNCELQLEIIALRQQNFKAGCILLFLVILFRRGVFLL